MDAKSIIALLVLSTIGCGGEPTADPTTDVTEEKARVAALVCTDAKAAQLGALPRVGGPLPSGPPLLGGYTYYQYSGDQAIGVSNSDLGKCSGNPNLGQIRFSVMAQSCKCHCTGFYDLSSQCFNKQPPPRPITITGHGQGLGDETFFAPAGRSCGSMQASSTLQKGVMSQAAGFAHGDYSAKLVAAGVAGYVCGPARPKPDGPHCFCQ